MNLNKPQTYFIDARIYRKDGPYYTVYWKIPGIESLRELSDMLECIGSAWKVIDTFDLLAIDTIAVGYPTTHVAECYKEITKWVEGKEGEAFKTFFNQQMVEGDRWQKKRKGVATIHTHPDAIEGRAIVEDWRGISFNGVPFDTLDAAKAAALSPAAPNG